MPYVVVVNKEPPAPVHLCAKPDTYLMGEKTAPGTIWQCQCGQLWLLKENITGRIYWKQISHKKGMELAGFVIPLKPQVQPVQEKKLHELPPKITFMNFLQK